MKVKGNMKTSERMKKAARLSVLSILAVPAVLLSGCNTASVLHQSATDASTQGIAKSYSCGQINSAFNAYEADKTSLAAMKQVIIMSGIDVDAFAATAAPQFDAASYFESAKAAANVALIMQGCQPRS